MKVCAFGFCICAYVHNNNGPLETRDARPRHDRALLYLLCHYFNEHSLGCSGGLISVYCCFVVVVCVRHDDGVDAIIYMLNNLCV